MTERLIKRSQCFDTHKFLQNDKLAIRLLDDLGFIKHWTCDKEECKKYEATIKDAKQKYY